MSSSLSTFIDVVAYSYDVDDDNDTEEEDEEGLARFDMIADEHVVELVVVVEIELPLL